MMEQGAGRLSHPQQPQQPQQRGSSAFISTPASSSAAAAAGASSSQLAWSTDSLHHPSNLHVDNLPTIDPTTFTNLFARFGPIASVRLASRAGATAAASSSSSSSHSSSSTYGFVMFEHAHDAERALAAMDGALISEAGELIEVATPPETDDAGKSQTPSTSSPSETHGPVRRLRVTPARNKRKSLDMANGENTNVYVAGLPRHVNVARLNAMFSAHGTIIESRVLEGKDDTSKYSVAFVRFASKQSSDDAIAAWNGKIVQGSSKPLVVRYAIMKASPAPHPHALPHQAPLTTSAPPPLMVAQAFPVPAAFAAPPSAAHFAALLPTYDPNVAASASKLNGGAAPFVPSFHLAADHPDPSSAATTSSRAAATPSPGAAHTPGTPHSPGAAYSPAPDAASSSSSSSSSDASATLRSKAGSPRVPAHSKRSSPSALSSLMSACSLETVARSQQQQQQQQQQLVDSRRSSASGGVIVEHVHSTKEAEVAASEHQNEIGEPKVDNNARLASTSGDDDRHINVDDDHDDGFKRAGERGSDKEEPHASTGSAGGDHHGPSDPTTSATPTTSTTSAASNGDAHSPATASIHVSTTAHSTPVASDSPRFAPTYAAFSSPTYVGAKGAIYYDPRFASPNAYARAYASPAHGASPVNGVSVAASAHAMAPTAYGVYGAIPPSPYGYALPSTNVYAAAAGAGFGDPMAHAHGTGSVPTSATGAVGDGAFLPHGTSTTVQFASHPAVHHAYAAYSPYSPSMEGGGGGTGYPFYAPYAPYYSYSSSSFSPQAAPAVAVSSGGGGVAPAAGAAQVAAQAAQASGSHSTTVSAVPFALPPAAVTVAAGAGATGEATLDPSLGGLGAPTFAPPPSSTSSSFVGPLPYYMSAVAGMMPVPTASSEAFSSSLSGPASSMMFAAPWPSSMPVTPLLAPSTPLTTTTSSAVPTPSAYESPTLGSLLSRAPSTSSLSSSSSASYASTPAFPRRRMSYGRGWAHHSASSSAVSALAGNSVFAPSAFSSTSSRNVAPPPPPPPPCTSSARRTSVPAFAGKSSGTATATTTATATMTSRAPHERHGSTGALNGAEDGEKDEVAAVAAAAAVALSADASAGDDSSALVNSQSIATSSAQPNEQASAAIESSPSNAAHDDAGPRDDVQEASLADRDPHSSSAHGSPSGVHQSPGGHGSTLFVYHVPSRMDEAHLANLFAACGTVVSVSVIRDLHNNAPKGYAFVDMSSLAEARAAIRGFNGYAIDGKYLKVTHKRVDMQRNPELMCANDLPRSIRAAYEYHAVISAYPAHYVQHKMQQQQAAQQQQAVQQQQQCPMLNGQHGQHAQSQQTNQQQIHYLSYEQQQQQQSLQQQSLQHQQHQQHHHWSLAPHALPVYSTASPSQPLSKQPPSGLAGLVAPAAPQHVQLTQPPSSDSESLDPNMPPPS